MNGDNTNEVYQYLKAQKSGVVSPMSVVLAVRPKLKAIALTARPHEDQMGESTLHSLPPRQYILIPLPDLQNFEKCVYDATPVLPLSRPLTGRGFSRRRFLVDKKGNVRYRHASCASKAVRVFPPHEQLTSPRSSSGRPSLAPWRKRSRSSWASRESVRRHAAPYLSRTTHELVSDAKL